MKKIFTFVLGAFIALSASAETINISFTEEQVTFQNGYDEYDDYYWEFVGDNANYVVTLVYYGDEEKLVGTYDVGDELNCSLSKIVDRQTGHNFWFDSGTIVITKEANTLHLHCEAKAIYNGGPVIINDYVIDMDYTPEETAVENVVLTEKAQKMVVDGQVYVIRDNKMYNVIGTQVR